MGATLVAAPASADVELAPLVSIDLSTFDGSGLNPEPAAGQLDSDDWSIRLSANAFVDFGGTAEGNGNVFAWGTSPGDVDDGGIWAFDVDGAGLIALGVQPTTNLFTPGRIALRLVNNTGADINEIQVEYTVWVFNDQSRANSFNLEESADNVTYNPVGGGFTSPAAADANGFTATDVVEIVTPAAPIADGSQYYISWAGDDASGDVMERDEFGLEGITIRLLNVCGNGLTEGDEGCDDGLENLDTGACTTACTVAACGDGFVQDGVEDCDDGNTDDGDGCAADCTVEEEPGTSTGADTSGGTDPDSSGSASASDSDSDTDSAGTGSASNSATGASATGASATAGSDTDGDDTGGSGGIDDGTEGCSCTSSGGTAPIWGMLGVVGLGLARRRRR